MSPAVNSHLVNIDRNGVATGTGSVQLEVKKKVPSWPAKMFRRSASRVLKVSICSIQIHPVIGNDPVFIAMRCNLDVMPCVSGPRFGVARNIGGVPVGAAVNYFRLFKASRPGSALGAKDYGPAV